MNINTSSELMDNLKIKKWLGDSLFNLRKNKGLVHAITNNVTIHDCANVVLAIGASPIMATHPEEVAEVTELSKSLVLNIGTVEVGTEASMLKAGKRAEELKIPVIFDPVGAGATAIRRRLSTELPAQFPIAVIRCNASEIMAIYNTSYRAGGVDALIGNTNEILEIAKKVAEKYHTVVAVTGETDYVTDGKTSYALHNGVALLPRLTGTGCMTSALVGAFLTAANPLIAAIAGISYMSVAGEIANARMNSDDGLGTFAIYLHDAISTITVEQFQQMVTIEEI